jgi:uncharacterized protein (UPF0332 family)
MNWEKDLIDYRREKAAETLENAKVSLEKKHLFSAVNRVYYALFYEISALLKTKNLSSPKHSGIRALFNQHFVKTGIVEVEIGKFYSDMFVFRQKGDYEDFIYFKENDVKEWILMAEKYISMLEKYIEKGMIEPGIKSESKK